MKARRSQSRPKMSANFRKSAAKRKALSPSNWLLIMHALHKSPHCVAEITDLVGLDRSTVSNHLTVLRKARFVTIERRGTQVFYRLRTPCLRSLFAWLEKTQAGDSTGSFSS